MSDTMVKEIVMKLRDIDQLFLAPDRDIFSDLEVEMFGESAFERVQKKLQPGFWKKSGTLRLVLLLPKEKIKPGLDEKVMRAIDKFVALSTADNKIAARTERWKGFRALLMSLAISLVLVGVWRLSCPGLLPAEISQRGKLFLCCHPFADHLGHHLEPAGHTGFRVDSLRPGKSDPGLHGEGGDRHQTLGIINLICD